MNSPPRQASEKLKGIFECGNGPRKRGPLPPLRMTRGRCQAMEAAPD